MIAASVLALFASVLIVSAMAIERQSVIIVTWVPPPAPTSKIIYVQKPIPITPSPTNTATLQAHAQTYEANVRSTQVVEYTINMTRTARMTAGPTSTRDIP